MQARIDDIVTRLGGVATHAEIVRAGSTRAEVASAWRSGVLVRIRHGVYALPGLPPDVERAIRVGGVLAGPSACEILGLWQPPSGPLHVSVKAHARALRDPDEANRPLDRDRRDVVILHDGERLDGRCERLHVSVRTCLRQTISRTESRFGLAVIDSAIRHHRLTARQVAEVRQELPDRCRLVVDRACATAESGTESLMRWGLCEASLAFESQKWVSDAIRVDFLVAGRVIVECVSYAFHASPRACENDRRRIAAAAQLGYLVLEFTYHQVFSDWDTVISTIRAAVLRG